MDGSDKFLKENRTCATWSNAGADDGDEIPPSAGLHKFRRDFLRLVPLIQVTYRASPGIPELRAAPAGRVNCSGSDLAPAAEPEAGFARRRSSHRVTAPAIRSTRYALTAWRPSIQTYLGAYRVGQRPDRAVRHRSPRPPLNLASPIIQQLRPWSMPVFAPNPKQREAAGRQKAKANAATKRMPHPMTAIGTGS
jgi:hypothetical protein